MRRRAWRRISVVVVMGLIPMVGTRGFPACRSLPKRGKFTATLARMRRRI
jgi:hypothetical protein